MAPDRGARAFALFDALVELSPEDRAARLDTLRSEDPALCLEVERLLAADARSGVDADSRDRLAKWAAHLLSTREDAPPSMPGQRLGPWRLVSPLGQGGMGTVWLAEREGEGFQQRAALKRIGHGLDTPAARERFLRERAILAQLDHPHIAGLLDGGVSEAG